METKMRLLPKETQAIRQVLLNADPHGRIFLFGSRMDDSKKGGDIDIFFESSKMLGLKSKLSLEYKLTTLCETKVDLLVKNPEQEEMAIFGIARKGVTL
jgi:predicted nucleotidyltransferase